MSGLTVVEHPAMIEQIDPTVSVVVPLYNEEENLDPAVAEILDALDGLPEIAELILVDDGSTDGTLLKAWAWSQRDPRVRVIEFRRNFGQTAALQAGMAYARGRRVVLMDGDQQNDPHDIAMLLAKMDEGYDVVSGWRRNRQDRALSRKLPSKVANGLISRVTGVRLHDYGCTLKVYDAEVVRDLRLYGELHRFIPALAGMSGARVVEVPVNHRARTRGKSKYGIGRMPRVLLDMFTVKFLLTYLVKPMQFFGLLGLVCFGFGLLTTIYLAGDKLLRSHSLADRPLLILACSAAVVGVVLMCTGLIMELLIRVYHEVGERAPFAVRRTSDDIRLEAARTSQTPRRVRGAHPWTARP
ncbi:MAG TPA: glycosyltransferase family 2 protein [Acidothermaceae bacterium]